jgi:hypothetical protein
MVQLVEIACFYDPVEAVCAKGFLHAKGLTPIMQNEHYLSVSPASIFALGGYRLMLPAQEAATGRKLLTEANEGQYLLKEDIKKCYACGSSNLRKRKNLFWVPVFLFSGVPFATYNGTVHCKTCNHIQKSEN